MTLLAKQLQALLFTAGEAVAISELASLLNISVARLSEVADELAGDLLAQGLALLITDTHLQLVTSPAVADWLALFEQSEVDSLSRAAMETLAIVAYRGPMARYDVDLLRGVDSRAMLRQLIKRGLIQRVSQAGVAPQYNITEAVLRHLGIKKREDLPDFVELTHNERLEELLSH